MGKKLIFLMLGLLCASLIFDCTYILAEDTVKLGVIVPFSGAKKKFGDLIQHGALIALDEVNAKGAKWIKFSPEEEHQYVQMSREAIFDFIGKQPGVTPELLDRFRAVMPGMK